MVPSAPAAAILVSHQGDQWKRFENALRTVCRSLREEAVAAGVGSPATDASEISTALNDAETAALWADLIGDAVVHYEDIAHLRMLPTVAAHSGDGLREAIGRFAELARYDLRHGTALSQTLDAYLSHRCSVTDTAAALYIHRNTLRQRLSRIDALTGGSTEHAGDWTVTALAARLSLVHATPETVRNSADGASEEGALG